MSHSRIQAKPSSAKLFIVLLFALVSLTTGCGDSLENYVVTGNQSGITTGAVRFRFANAQVVTVPIATTKIHIEFFDAAGQEVLETVPDRDFSAIITVEDVPGNAVRAKVTAKSATGVPLASVEYDVTVTAGGITDAVPRGAAVAITFDSLETTPATVSVTLGTTAMTNNSLIFSDGTRLAAATSGGALSFLSEDPAIASVNDSTGRITGVSAGNTTVTASYVLNGVTRTDTVSVRVTIAADNILVANPSSVTLDGATSSVAIATTFNGETVTATGDFNGSFQGGVNATNLVFINGTVSCHEAVSGSATLTLTFGSATTTVPVVVDRFVPARLELLQDNNLALVPGSSSRDMVGFYFPPNQPNGVVITTNELVGVPISADPPGTEANWSFTNRHVVTPGSSGQSPAVGDSVTFRLTYTPPDGSGAVSTELRVTAVAAGDPLLSKILRTRLATLPGNSLKLPTGSEYPIFIAESTGSGLLLGQNPATTDGGTPPTPGQYNISSSNSSAVSYDTATACVVFGAVGSSTVTITRNNTDDGGIASVGTYLMTSVDPSLLAPAAPATNNAFLRIVGNNSGPLNTIITYAIELLYQDGSRQDITPVGGVAVTGGVGLFDTLGRTRSSVKITAAPPSSGTVRLTSTFNVDRIIIPGYLPDTTTTLDITSTP